MDYKAISIDKTQDIKGWNDSSPRLLAYTSHWSDATQEIASGSEELSDNSSEIATMAQNLMGLSEAG